ncbi:hypothetical protein ACS0TY_028466 [Phlomoides rotata]
MAFLNRVGNVLKQTVSKHAALQFPASNASPFQAIRSMSTASKLFVGGLSYNTDEMSLREAFAQYGEVVEARVITDRETGRSRGFGFVTFTSSESASSAMQAFDGQDLHGRRVRVNFATEKPRAGGFGGGGFGGGYGGGQGGNYGGGYGGQGGNYGGGYGGQGGNYGGGGYQGGGGNYGGGGGYGTNNPYPSGGGGYGNAVGGEAAGFGGGDSVPAGGSYSGGGSNYPGGQAGLSSILNDETTGLPSEIQQPPSGHQNAGIEDLEDTYDENTRDEIDDANDFANTRR